MAIISAGQITLVDLTDQRTSSFYLQADKSKVQVYDVNAKKEGDTSSPYQPDYSSGSGLTITPEFSFGTESYSLSNAQIEYTLNGQVVDELGDEQDPGNRLYYVRKAALHIVGNLPDVFARLEGSDTSGTMLLRVVATIPAKTLTDPKTGLVVEKAVAATLELSLVKTGEAGKSVKKVETLYQCTTTQEAPSVPTDDTNGNWETDISKVVLDATNKYLWAFQRVYYKDHLNNETFENGTAYFAGAYGDTGAVGRGISSLTEEYYISTSATGLSGGSWTSTPPTNLTEGKYLWVRTKITYDDDEEVYKPSENGTCDSTWNLAVSKITEYNQNLNVLQQSLSNVQEQVDGAISSWYGDVKPELNNYPASDWGSVDTKIAHNGDLYYNNTNGEAYRYVIEVNISGDTPSVTKEAWVLIRDNALTEAVGQIQDLGTKVDGKMTIYYNNPDDAIAPFPAEAEVGDLWFRGVAGDQYKCKQAYSSEIVLTSITWTDYWEVANKSLGRVDMEFYKHNDSTKLPEDLADSEWSTISPKWEQGKFIWQRTATYSRSGELLYYSVPVCISTASRSISTVENYYLASNQPSGVTTGTSGWDPDVSKAVTSKDAPYLWNYEEVTYNYGDPDTSDPVIIGYYSEDGKQGDPGRGITNVLELYHLTQTNVEPEKKPTGVEENQFNGWSKTVLTSTDEKPYLWNIEIVEYSDGDVTIGDPIVIGYRGVGIKNSITYFQRTNSALSSELTDSWDTTFVDVDKDNQYLWSYTVTTLTDGTIQESAKAIVARYTEDGAPAVYGWIESDGREIFTDENEASIVLTARMMVGGQEKKAEEGVTYKWYCLANGDEEGDEIGTANTLTVTRDMVPNVEVFTCVMSDGTYEVLHRFPLRDQKDSIWCEIISSAGDKFINSNIETVLTAVLYNDDGQLSEERVKKYYFQWIKQEKDGDIDETFVPTYNAAGKGAAALESPPRYVNAIDVGAGDVSSKAIFSVQVYETDPDET